MDDTPPWVMHLASGVLKAAIDDAEATRSSNHRAQAEITSAREWLVGKGTARPSLTFWCRAAQIHEDLVIRWAHDRGYDPSYPLDSPPPPLPRLTPQATLIIPAPDDEDIDDADRSQDYPSCRGIPLLRAAHALRPGRPVRPAVAPDDQVGPLDCDLPDGDVEDEDCGLGEGIGDAALDLSSGEDDADPPQED